MCVYICNATKTLLSPWNMSAFLEKRRHISLLKLACRLRSSSVLLTKKNYGNLLKSGENPAM